MYEVSFKIRRERRQKQRKKKHETTSFDENKHPGNPDLPAVSNVSGLFFCRRAIKTEIAGAGMLLSMRNIPTKMYVSKEPLPTQKY